MASWAWYGTVASVAAVGSSRSDAVLDCVLILFRGSGASLGVIGTTKEMLPLAALDYVAFIVRVNYSRFVV